VRPDNQAAPSKHSERSEITSIPFEYDRLLMPYIVVQASINGQPPLPFVVDTGAADYFLAVEPWAAKKIGLPSLWPSGSQFVNGQGQKAVTCTLVKTVNVMGGGKNDALDFAFDNKFFTTEAGRRKDTPFQIVSFYDAFRDSYRGPPPAGIIPLDTLRLPGLVWRIDFQRKRLIFIKGGWKPPAGASVVPLRHVGSSALLHLSAGLVRGNPIDFELDTGCSDTRMHDMAARTLPGGQSTQDLFAPQNRERFYDTALLPELHLGTLVEPNVTIHETESALSLVSDNLLGLDFLSRFLVTLDLAENKMYLERRPDYARQIVPPGRAGVRLEKRAEQSVAAWVEPDSPAFRAGLRVGNRVEQVDGQPLEALPLWGAQNLLDGFEGTSATLIVRAAAGKEVTLSFTRSKKFLGRRHALLGVSLDWVQGNLMVSGVTPGSPLEHILKWGDDIYSIGDRQVAKMTMDEAFQQLERPDVSLQVWRDMDKTWQELHIAPLPAQTQVLAGPLPAANRYSFNAQTGWTAAPL